MLTLLFANICFSQTLEKVVTDEPIRTNYVDVHGQFLAKFEIYTDSAQLTFKAKGGSIISISMKIESFYQMADVLLSYDNKDKDFYVMKVSGSEIQIRYVTRYGYTQSHISLLTPNGLAKFPEFNMHQLTKLFKR